MTVLILGFVFAAPAGANFSFLSQWGTEGTGTSQFQFAAGLGIDSHDNIYVADGGNGRVSVFTSAGAPIVQCGSQGTAISQLNHPVDVAVDSRGYIYVTDGGGQRIKKFAPITANVPCGYVTSWPFSFGGSAATFPYGIAIAPRDAAVYAVGGMVSATGQFVRKYSTSGGELAQWGGLGTGPGQFTGYMHVATDGTGQVFVADYVNGRVQRFSSGGTFNGFFGSQGTGDGQFHGPHGLAVDRVGGVWVAETGINYRFQQFTSAGMFAAKYGHQGTGPGEFTIAYDVVTDSNCNVYVLDTSGVFAGVERVQKFGQTEAPYCRAPVGIAVPGVDTTRPVVKLSRPHLRALFSKQQFHVITSCPQEDCIAGGTATISVPAGAAKVYRVKARSKQAKKGRRVRLVFHLNVKTVNAIRRARNVGRTVRFRVTARSVDGAGNLTAKSATARL